MSATTQTRRRWTETTIEEALRTQMDDLGHFPARSELVARGLRSLWDAMRTTGGVETWRERLEREQPNGGHQDGEHPNGGHPNGGRTAPSQEEIASLAYALYERGAPGDAEAHWFAAEQQLN